MIREMTHFDTINLLRAGSQVVIEDSDLGPVVSTVVEPLRTINDGQEIKINAGGGDVYVPINAIPIQVVFPDKIIFVGQLATVGFGDRKPAKIKSITRVPRGWNIILQTYCFEATEAGKKIGMGHQDWTVRWDQPSLEYEFRTDLNGEIINTGSGLRVFLGNANPNYCWEL